MNGIRHAPYGGAQSRPEDQQPRKVRANSKKEPRPVNRPVAGREAPYVRAGRSRPGRA